MENNFKIGFSLWLIALIRQMGEEFGRSFMIHRFRSKKGKKEGWIPLFFEEIETAEALTAKIDYITDHFLVRSSLLCGETFRQNCRLGRRRLSPPPFESL